MNDLDISPEAPIEDIVVRKGKAYSPVPPKSIPRITRINALYITRISSLSTGKTLTDVVSVSFGYYYFYTYCLLHEADCEDRLLKTTKIKAIARASDGEILPSVDLDETARASMMNALAALLFEYGPEMFGDDSFLITIHRGEGVRGQSSEKGPQTSSSNDCK